MSRQAIDPALRAQAMELARTEGVAVAAERTGLKPGTIRVWLSRSEAKAAPPAVAAPATVGDAQIPGLGEFESKTLVSAKRAVDAALKRLEELIPTAKGIQSVAISSGILMDKIERLNEVVADAQERTVRIAQGDAEWLTAAMTLYMQALGLPWEEGGAARKCWAAILRGGARGVPFRMPPDVDVGAAREALLSRVRSEVRAELEQEQRERAEAERMARPALPAPRTDEERLADWQEEQRTEPEPDDETDIAEPVEATEVLEADDPGAPASRPGPGWIWKQGRWQRPGGRLPPQLGGSVVRSRW